MLEGATKLKALSTISVGFDNFDVADLTRRGIVLAHTPDVLTESTADTVFSLILATARRVVELADWVKAGQVARRASARRNSASTCRARRSASSGWGASAARSRGARRSAST